MAMPALQAWQAMQPQAIAVAVVKPAVAPLWRMHRSISEIIELGPGWNGVHQAAGRIRAIGAQLAFVLPHSFRSALVPFAARIPERVGMPGHARDVLLTRVVRPEVHPGREHQAYSYLDVMAPDAAVDALPAVDLRIPAEAEHRAQEWLGLGRWVGLLPGAARGPAKQWPAERFVELGRRLIRSSADVDVAVMGSAGEEPLCRRVADAIRNERVLNLAGRTTFAEWAAVLRRCAVVVANDSGGMHLSAAVGTPVVALYGITDPVKTGPLGQSRILQRAGPRSRDVPRDSRIARDQLAAIQPIEVHNAVDEFLCQPRGEVACAALKS
jgi:heptosyltransferase-2